MKKKLITFFVVLLALTGFHAKAVVVGIQAGDTTIQKGLLAWQDPALAGPAAYTNERGGYASTVRTNVVDNNKLTFDGTNFVFKNASLSVKLGSADRLFVQNPTTGTVSISTEDLKNTLSLTYKGTTTNQFVVFRNAASDSTGTGPFGHLARVPQYDQFGQGAAASGGIGDPEQVLRAQDFNSGSFEGFLGVYATGFVDDSALLIVVHDNKGVLSLMPYNTYAKTIVADNTSLLYGDPAKDPAKNKLVYYPLYIKTQQLAGRWATAADFKDCKFQQFTASVANSDKVLTVYDATAVQADTTAKAKAYSTFTVKNVDFVANFSDAVTGTAGTWIEGETNNLVTMNQTADKFEGDGVDSYYGTDKSNTLYPNGVIPLFVLAAPESDGCKVLSVSRINHLETQSQQDGGYANQLELRDYATYYTYDENTKTKKWDYTMHSAIPAYTQGADSDAIYDTYTSLQKFAIWIDNDGHYILYPAASYFWKYGYDKGNVTDGEPDPTQQSINIQPNAVLTYNNIHVTLTAGATADADKANGMQIGWWTGKASTDPKATAGFTTVPNEIQTMTNYLATPFDPTCMEDDGDFSARFYFLKVDADTTDLWDASIYPASMTADQISAITSAFGKKGYQFGREYVLGTQINNTFGGGSANPSKSLAIIPKEIQGADDAYWRFPYDSVNMAAHWEIKAHLDGDDKIDGYYFINMLGDTLKYNPPATAANQLALRGGYVADNNFIAGDPLGGGMLYFGRPEVEGTAMGNWFNQTYSASTAATADLWTIHKLKGSDTFFIELQNSNKQEITLTPSLGVYPNTKGWYDGNTIRPTLPHMSAGNGSNYFQQSVTLDATDLATTSYQDGNFSTCGGMKMTLEEIGYVPKFSDKHYTDEQVNEIVNTNDPTYQKQDSLTAYTFLTGSYAIVEATAVQSGQLLQLGYEDVSINDVNKTTASVARLKTTNDQVQFIPLNDPAVSGRTKQIEDAWTHGVTNNAPATLSYSVADAGLDTLYGETYKWYIVKAGNKYLSFDTVNVTAKTNREKVGLVFVDTLANAIPVRLYQPLVGDKANDNFLIQFYIPNFKYHPDWAGNEVVTNVFPAIESSVLTDMKGGPSAGDDQVCFATLSNQSDFIFASRAYNSTSSGTRFTFVHNPTPSTCPAMFVDPQWMGENRLLSLPLNNQLWEKGAAITAWVATGAKDAGIITNDGAESATTLTHTYVTTIKVYSGGKDDLATYNEAGFAKVAIPGTWFDTKDSVLVNDTTWIGGKDGLTVGTVFQKGQSFATDLDVPLYYVQNADGKYLTVVADNDMTDPSSTMPDVNGMKLAWRDKIAYSNTDVDSLHYDSRVLQLFAISGCEGDADENGNFGEFVYLPLASYQYDYAKNAIILQASYKYNGKTYANVPAVFYNEHLGKALNPGYPGNDLTACWRVAQYSWVGSSVKNLVVFNSSSSAAGGNLVPIQVKWSKQNYIQPDCEYYLVKNIGYGEDANLFYNFTGKVENANEYSLAAHWTLATPDTTDEFMYTFVPEMETVYGDTIGKQIPQNQLLGQYYFVKEVTTDNGTGYLAIDVSGYDNNDFTAVFDTLQLTCTEHKMPFFDLEADGHFNLGSSLAVLETPFVDRNLTYNVAGESTPVYRGAKLIGYQTYIDTVGTDFSNADYLTVYRENRRELTPKDTAGNETHVIPYYSFSITTGGKEYFLNVDSYSGRDSVYWTTISATDKTTLLDFETNPDSMKTFKFCLPYQVDSEGSFAKEVAYGDMTYKPVYLQTLDTAKDDYPFLVVAGSATKYVTARKLQDAILTAYNGSDPKAEINTLEWNIYTVDYRYINPSQVTAWIFGGAIPNADVWVPIAGVIADGTQDGALTNLPVGTNGGVTFVDQSNNSPVNFGIMGGIKPSSNLTVEFDGDTTIGTWTKSPIWYYRINIGGKYLTDATPKAPNANYMYPFLGDTYPYGYFGAKLDAFDDYAAEGITADSAFVQSFGFKYVDGGKQSFNIVSNANYTFKSAHEDEYRFLASMNDHLVFVNDQKTAMIFQWGGIEDGTYTNLKVVGSNGIFGVTGGVKFMNTTGPVEIYSIDGRMIKSAVLTGSEQVLPAPRGIAVVKAGATVVKVIVQ